MAGVINGTAPNPVRMNEMCDRIGALLGRPSWLPVPEFAVRVLLGEGAMIVCLLTQIVALLSSLLCT